jgi:arabinogalactan oligomer / maltooligosaccharide transport system permease protein
VAGWPVLAILVDIAADQPGIRRVEDRSRPSTLSAHIVQTVYTTALAKRGAHAARPKSPPAAGGGRQCMLRVKRSTIALYMAPMLLVTALITVFPIGYSVYLSFTNKSLFHLFDYHFVGLQNYSRLLGSLDADFYYVIGITLLYVVVCVALFLIFGLATALALNNPAIRWLPMWRLILIVPWAVPTIVTALIWRFLFHYDFGPFNQILRVIFGLGNKDGVPWLLDPHWAFFSVVLVNLWMSFPPFTIVILGALQSIPKDLYEAAAVDGATAFQRLRTITLPLLRPAVTPWTILSAITTFQIFNTVFLVTASTGAPGGGPYPSALKPGATEFVMIYMYNHIFADTSGNPHYGQIAAFSVLIFFLLLLATIGALRATNLTREAQA